jgi:hypothetical protein
MEWGNPDFGIWILDFGLKGLEIDALRFNLWLNPKSEI